MAGTFQVMDRKCNQCLYDPKNRIVSAARASQIMRDCTRKDNNFICHKSSILGEEVTCAGDFEQRGPGQLARIAGRIGCLERVSVDDYERRLKEKVGK